MKNHYHIPKEIQFLAIEEESEINNERPEHFLPDPAVTWSYRSDSRSNGFLGQGGLL